MVSVPDIAGHSLTEARDILSSYGLSIDDSEITWTLTEDTPANTIISFTPAEGSKVENGSKIKVVVSEGTYSTMLDYIGMDIEEVKTDLKSKNFNVEATAVQSEKAPGTILSQEGINPGDKYTPNIVNTVKFTYSAARSAVIPFGTIGRNVYTVYEEFSYAGFSVTMQSVSYDSLSEEERNLGSNNVVKVSPEEGALFTQEEGASIILYYYE